MTYNFDEIISRRGTNSVKWDDVPSQVEDGGSKPLYPLWVADMDFRTYPPIIEALHRRVDHGIFGYTHVPDSYYDSIIRWFEVQHGWQGIQPEQIIYTSGVVPAVSAIIRALTLPGDKVLVHTPAYNCFFSSIRNQGCLMEEAPLKRIPLAPEAPSSSPKPDPSFTYTLDWEAFERACADPRVRVFLLCNPHNPSGRVWTADELRRMGDICLRHDVFVIADEIHCEVVMPGYRYTPFASLGEEYACHSATCVSPTKGFNIAGLQIANIIVPDAAKRERIDRVINLHENCDVNPFGVIALQEAYTDGGAEWLHQLCAYIEGNYRLLCEMMPMVPVAKLEGTYLAWMEAPKPSAAAFVARLLSEQGIRLNDGLMYGDHEDRYLRLNLACPRPFLRQVLSAMQKMIDQK